MKKRDLISIMNYYKEYYFKHSEKVIHFIKDVESREFAYVDFETNSMIRHVSIKPKEFKEWLIEHIPRDFYHSAAYYLFPSKNMEAKGWEGADLVFDIDLDHISDYSPTIVRLCIKDEHINILNKMEECDGDLKKFMILNEEGYNKAKRELIRLIETLNSDLDIPIEIMNIFFSGGRGFHIHIHNKDYHTFSSYERMEIKDYLTYDGIDIRYIRSFEARPLKQFISLVMNDDERLKNFFKEDELKTLKKFFMTEDMKNFSRYMKKNLSLARKINSFIPKFLGINIDGVVTMDTSRLIRVPYSLHGKTGMIKKKIKYDDIDEFNPLIHAVRDDEYKIKLKISYCPKMFWFDDDYGPYYKEEAIVPFSLGIYLIREGLAYDIYKY